MDLTSDLVAPVLAWIGHGIFWPLVLVALARAPWSVLRDPDAIRVWICATVAVLVLWQIVADAAATVHAHLLGAAAMTLMFRWSFALLSLTAVLLGTTLAGHGDWSLLGLNGLLLVMLPVTTAYLLWRINERWLPANLFVYVFVAAFAGGLLSMAVVAVAAYQLLLLAGRTADIVLDQYGAVFLLLAYPEAFLTGAALSIFIVYRPQWVATFDDRRYLRQQ